MKLAFSDKVIVAEEIKGRGDGFDTATVATVAAWATKKFGREVSVPQIAILARQVGVKSKTKVARDEGAADDRRLERIESKLDTLTHMLDAALKQMGVDAQPVNGKPVGRDVFGQPAT